jgi:hypothetical protein
LHSKKIRRQKIVGEKGVEQFDYDKRRRRFVFDDYPLQKFLEKNQIEIREFNTRDFTEPKKSEDDDFTVF